MIISLLLVLTFLPLQNPKPDTVRVMEYCDLSYDYILKNADSAIFFGEKAIELAKEINYDKGLAQAYNDLGFVYYYKSEYPKARELWANSAEIRKRLSDSTGIAAIYVKLGALNFQTGNFSDALNDQLNALAIYEAMGHDEGIAKTYNNIALVHESQDQLEKALEYFQKSLQIKQKLEDHYEIGGALINLGKIFHSQKDLEKTHSSLSEAISTLESNGFENTVYLAAAYNSMGSVYMDLAKIDSAVKFIAKGMEIREFLGDQQGIISSLNKLGLIESERDNYRKAIALLSRAGSLADKKQLLNEKRDSYQNLSLVHRKFGNYQKALESLDRYHAIKDSLLNEHSAETIAELQTKYETEKKEQQIALQTTEIAEQKAKNQRNLAVIIGLVFVLILLGVIAILIRGRSKKKQALMKQESDIKLKEMQIDAAISSQEKERSRFAKDLHDGFGQMISVLNLNLKPLQDKGGDSHSVFEKSTQILEEMYQELKGICFNLMPQTLIQYGIGPAINEFAERINSTNKFYISVDIFGLDDRLTDVQEISLYRITQEWVNNIMKYSDADKITVQVTKDEEEVTLLIEDNGSGFDIGQLKAGKGNGWKNMNSRINLMKGELELDTTPGIRGNTLIVNAPVLTPKPENIPV